MHGVRYGGTMLPSHAPCRAITGSLPGLGGFGETAAPIPDGRLARGSIFVAVPT